MTKIAARFGVRHNGRVAALLVMAMAMTGGCRDDSPSVVVVHADSLSRPLEELKAAFEAANPGVRVELSPYGSVLACRQLQTGVPCDVVALADRHLFAEQLAPHGLTDWSVCFAASEVVILKTGRSRHANEITQANWFEVLTRPDVRVGIADATMDPCGYWTRLVWQLADKHYKREGAGQRISDALEAKCDAAHTRPDSQQLIAMVEGAGGWDYAFVYRAQAEQNHLAYVRLPEAINLGAKPGTGEAAAYAGVEVAVPEIAIRRRGEPLVFALSIPRAARQPQLAEQFVAFVLSASGQAIANQAGLPALDRPWSETPPEGLPSALRPLVGPPPALR